MGLRCFNAMTARLPAFFILENLFFYQETWEAIYQYIQQNTLPCSDFFIKKEDFSKKCSIYYE